jgi:hypothetical protein
MNMWERIYNEAQKNELLENHTYPERSVRKKRKITYIEEIEKMLGAKDKELLWLWCCSYDHVKRLNGLINKKLKYK